MLPTRNDVLTQDENRKIVLAFTSMSRLVWGLTQVVVYQLEDDPVCTDFVIAVKEAQTEMINTLRDLGVDTEPFENYEIRIAAKEHPDN
jgi:hypothetical protein